MKKNDDAYLVNLLAFNSRANLYSTVDALQQVSKPSIWPALCSLLKQVTLFMSPPHIFFWDTCSLISYAFTKISPMWIISLYLHVTAYTYLIGLVCPRPFLERPLFLRLEVWKWKVHTCTRWPINIAGFPRNLSHFSYVKLHEVWILICTGYYLRKASLTCYGTFH